MLWEEKAEGEENDRGRLRVRFVLGRGPNRETCCWLRVFVLLLDVFCQHYFFFVLITRSPDPPRGPAVIQRMLIKKGCWCYPRPPANVPGQLPYAPQLSPPAVK